jgi:hypothetical protein
MQIGGALQIQSKGNGTTVLVVLPIRGQAITGSGTEALTFETAWYRRKQ